MGTESRQTGSCYHFRSEVLCQSLCSVRYMYIISLYTDFIVCGNKFTPQAMNAAEVWDQDWCTQGHTLCVYVNSK